MRGLQMAFYAGLVMLAGAVAAVLAHLAIDVAGDYLLAHDTYDGVAHHSRGLLLGVALVVAAIVALRYVFEIFDRRASSMVNLVRTLRAARGTRLWGFVGWVSALTPLLLVGMESYDLLTDFGRIASFRALLGGSVELGLVSALASALVAAGLVQVLVRLLAVWEPAIAEFAARLTRDERRRPRYVSRALLLTTSLDAAGRLARRCGKRAPPLTTPV